MDSNGSTITPPPRPRRAARAASRSRSAAADPAAPPADGPGVPEPGAPPAAAAEHDPGVSAQLPDAADELPPTTGVIVRSGAAIPEATLASLEMTQGAIGRLDAEEVSVAFGAIGATRADRVTVELGSVGAAMANELTVTQGAAGTVLAGNATLDGAIVRTLVARRVVVTRPTVVGFLVARRVNGDVRALFDWRGAVVFGLIVGLVAGLGRRRR